MLHRARGMETGRIGAGTRRFLVGGKFIARLFVAWFHYTRAGARPSRMS